MAKVHGLLTPGAPGNGTAGSAWRKLWRKTSPTPAEKSVVSVIDDDIGIIAIVIGWNCLRGETNMVIEETMGQLWQSMVVWGAQRSFWKDLTGLKQGVWVVYDSFMLILEFPNIFKAGNHVSMLQWEFVRGSELDWGRGPHRIVCIQFISVMRTWATDCYTICVLLINYDLFARLTGKDACAEPRQDGSGLGINCPKCAMWLSRKLRFR